MYLGIRVKRRTLELRKRLVREAEISKKRRDWKTEKLNKIGRRPLKESVCTWRTIDDMYATHREC